MKVLVTGAAGFIGMHLAQRSAQRRRRVVAVDSFDPYYDVALKRRARRGSWKSAGVRCEALDLADAVGDRGFFVARGSPMSRTWRAQPGVRYSLINPAAYLRNNVDRLRRRARRAVVTAASSTWSTRRARASTAQITRCRSPRTRTSIIR